MKENSHIAGFFDGEGSVFLAKETRRQPYEFPVVCFSNTCRDVILWIHGKLRGGSIVMQRRKEAWNPCYTLRYEALLEVEKILSALIPYLIVKKLKAETALTMVQNKLKELKDIS